MTRRIGILTSGGDAPGMNAAIRAVVRETARGGGETVAFRRGFEGLCDDRTRTLESREVANILQRGGSILDTSRCPRFFDPDWRERAAEVLDDRGCEALVVIGGDGSHAGGAALQQAWGGAVIGVPATIDNDVGGTDRSIGFDTACNTALEAVDRVRDTAHTLDRPFFIEVMGRDRGFLALEVAIGGGAEAVLVPEFDFDPDRFLDVLGRNVERGKVNCIVVVAEGAHPGGVRGLLQELEERLESIGIAANDARITILGHIQRGGNPTSSDRVLASRLGAAAAEAARHGEPNVMVVERGPDVRSVPIPDALADEKQLDRSLLELVDVLAG